MKPLRMGARIERGQAKLLTHTGLDWSAEYPARGRAGEDSLFRRRIVCVGDEGLPSFAETQAATNGAGRVGLVFYAFDLLHLDGRNTAALVLTERKAPLEPVMR